ncbi:alpha-amylase [Streptomyces sp. NPDC057101]|uniref:alpha-amylase n=1 Tax=Streptomyces sp. NPDC057101 TaxID=3346020 RepID=UPI0036429983
MTNLMARTMRPAALAATAVVALLMALTAAPSAGAAAEAAAPGCVQYHSGWRYTNVVNGCDFTVAVTVEYTDGQAAPCRVIEPGAWATFAGYGSQFNYATGLRTCDPATASGA